MQYMFFTDIHLGVSRAANTSSRSKLALQAHLYELAQDIVAKGLRAGARIFNLGDMFDRHSNKEPIVLQGLKVARSCDRVLAGNHDQINIVGSMGSLALVREALMEENPNDPRIIINPDPTQPYAFTEFNVADRVSMSFVPHCYTQELFEQSIEIAIADAHDSAQEGSFKILCLHCNIGDFGHSEPEASTLCLTELLQDVVAESFDLILVGHEHTPATLHKGKIVVLGNTHPVSFGEIADRFIYWFDTTTRTLNKEQIFKASDEYQIISAEDLIEAEGQIDTPSSMIDITGLLKPQEWPKLSRALQNFWRRNEENVFAVRNQAEVDKPDSVKRTKAGYIPRTLPEVVADEIKDTPFQKEYDELAAEVQS